MKKRIFLDYASSTPVDPAVFREVAPYIKSVYGNPSSMHSFGQKTRAAIEEARSKVALFLHASPQEIVFTSGATESNTLAVQGVVRQKRKKGKPHIVISSIEHESVRGVCNLLQERGEASVTELPVSKDGIVNIKDVENALQDETVLVSVCYVNSVLGVVQPVDAIGGYLFKKKNKWGEKILFHTDAVQAAHYRDCNIQELKADLLTLSAHKIYGPKGVGALFVKNGIMLSPFQRGGGQERGIRSGTENVPGIVGLGKALEKIGSPERKVMNIRIRQGRDRLLRGVLRTVPGSVLVGSLEQRAENNAYIRFPGILGADLVLALDRRGVAVSTGSACSEQTQGSPHVLEALGVKGQEAKEGIRITLGKYTTPLEVDTAIKEIARAVSILSQS
ncbi:MAG: cysteine desulfurase family protein [bacterium]|nr:cysteine desulfurase family protein [bacterium]